mgnify:CR=1 FL=1
MSTLALASHQTYFFPKVVASVEKLDQHKAWSMSNLTFERNLYRSKTVELFRCQRGLSQTSNFLKGTKYSKRNLC